MTVTAIHPDFFFDDGPVNRGDGPKDIDVSTEVVVRVQNDGLLELGPAEASGSPNCTTGGRPSRPASKT